MTHSRPAAGLAITIGVVAREGPPGGGFALCAALAGTDFELLAASTDLATTVEALAPLGSLP